MKPHEIANLEQLEVVVNTFKMPGNCIREVLKPLRDIVFHYDNKKATEWAEQRMEDEKGRKPPIMYMDLVKSEFGPGIEYNEHIFSNSLFMHPSARMMFFQNQQITQDLQERYLGFVKALSKYLLKRAKIKKREFDWFMQYMYGFRPSEGEM